MLMERTIVYALIKDKMQKVYKLIYRSIHANTDLIMTVSFI